MTGVQTCALPICEVQHDFIVVAFDGENFLEDGLESDHHTLVGRSFFLQKLAVGIKLDLDKIRRIEHFLDFAKLETV